MSDSAAGTARAHPLYAGWGAAPPVSQLLELTYSSDIDFLAYGAAERLPVLRNALKACSREGSIAPVGTFADPAYWAGIDRDPFGAVAIDDVRYRSDDGWGSYDYHAYAVIAGAEDSASGQATHDLQRFPADLCLSVTFTDLNAEEQTNTIIVPRAAVVAALQGADLVPGEAYRGPVLPAVFKPSGTWRSHPRSWRRARGGR
jgi:hypothetical protein